MIGRRSHRPYKPSQLLTGHVDDFPLVPETHIDIAPRPILQSAPPTAEEPAAPVAAEPAAGTPPIAAGPDPAPPGNKADIECLEAAKEPAAIAPISGLPGRRNDRAPEASVRGAREIVEPGRSVANEMLRILESGERPPAATTAIVQVAADEAKSRRRKKSHSKRKKTSPPPGRLSRLELHQSHCKICGYEDQDEIDEAFVSWENVSQIAEDYERDRRAIYRHANATGLYAKRDRNIRRALGRIIQEADFVTASADSVVRAVKMLTHVNAHGDWVQPPTHVIFSSPTAHPGTERSDTPCKVKKGLKP
jgi:predicted Zn-ribbon and HTH transcriptional regulator